MNHLDEGALLAVRDGEAADEAERHLEACEACRQALETVRLRRGFVADALSGLDEPFALAPAREAVRARASRGRLVRARTVRRSLRRAAGVALFLGAAGAAWAMPGSPVPGWLSRLEGSAEAGSTAAASPSAQTGVQMDMASGPARIVLTGAGPGTEIEVVLVDGTTAAVTAPRGTRYATSQGRIEAAVAPGAVRVRLPRGVHPATLEVSGRIYLRNTDAGLQVPGPATDRTGRTIHFTVPAG